MNDFLKYKKPTVSKSDKVVTSVNIRQDQKDFLDKHKLELSPIVRDKIDEMMKQEAEKEAKSG